MFYCGLAELLIVVAIIAVLVAISIPIFNAQLEKAREATDAANLRAAYAEVMTAALTDAENDNEGVKRSGDSGSYVWTKDVKATQTQDKWQGTDYSTGDNTIGGVHVNSSTKGWTVTYTQNAGKITFPETT